MTEGHMVIGWMTQGTYGPQVLTVGENYVIRTEGTYGPLASHLW